MSDTDVRPVFIRRDPDRERDSMTEVAIIASGVELPSGTIIVEWNRDAFEEGERAEYPVQSQYRSAKDAEQATGGRVAFEQGVSFDERV